MQANAVLVKKEIGFARRERESSVKKDPIQNAIKVLSIPFPNRTLIFSIRFLTLSFCLILLVLSIFTSPTATWFYIPPSPSLSLCPCFLPIPSYLSLVSLTLSLHTFSLSLLSLLLSHSLTLCLIFFLSVSTPLSLCICLFVVLSIFSQPNLYL